MHTALKRVRAGVRAGYYDAPYLTASFLLLVVILLGAAIKTGFFWFGLGAGMGLIGLCAAGYWHPTVDPKVIDKFNDMGANGL